MLKKYEIFLETRKITELDRKKYLQFSSFERVKEKLSKYFIFKDLYDDKDYFYALRPLKDISHFAPTPNDRVTLLRPTTFQDTDINNSTDPKHRKYKLLNLDFDTSENLFFLMVKAKRTKGEKFKTPEKEDFYPASKVKKHYCVIPLDKTIEIIKLLDNSREATGTRIERQLTDINTAWKNSHNNFSVMFNRVMDAKKNPLDQPELVKNNAKMRTLFIEGPEFFDISVPDSELSKWDAICDDGNDKNLNIEIKRYKINNLLDKTGSPKEILLAEQLKISQESSIRSAVNIYIEATGDSGASILLNLTKKKDLEKEFDRKKKKSTSNKDIYFPYVEKVRNFINNRIEEVFTLYQTIQHNEILKKTYGVYFFYEDFSSSFLVKTEDISYNWEVEEDYAGFDRISLNMIVNPNADIYFYVNEEKRFVKTYKLKDYKKYKNHQTLKCEGGEIVFDKDSQEWIFESKNDMTILKTLN